MSLMRSTIRNLRIVAAMILLSIISFYGFVTLSTANPVVVAQSESKHNGNELLDAVNGGANLKDMTKQQIIDEYGEPASKDTTGEKGRYDEKWTYTCETHNGLDYDCVFIFFMADRVVNVDNF